MEAGITRPCRLAGGRIHQAISELQDTCARPAAHLTTCLGLFQDITANIVCLLHLCYHPFATRSVSFSHERLLRLDVRLQMLLFTMMHIAGSCAAALSVYRLHDRSKLSSAHSITAIVSLLRVMLTSANAPECRSGDKTTHSADDSLATKSDGEALEFDVNYYRELNPKLDNATASYKRMVALTAPEIGILQLMRCNVGHLAVRPKKLRTPVIYLPSNQRLKSSFVTRCRNLAETRTRNSEQNPPHRLGLLSTLEALLAISMQRYC